jgi:hypothetical protein
VLAVGGDATDHDKAAERLAGNVESLSPRHGLNCLNKEAWGRV